MTITQLKNAGIICDSWQTLQGICNQLLFSNEAALWVSPIGTQFYFDSTTGALYIRYATETENIHSSGETTYIGYINENGKTEQKRVYLFRGGVVDKKIGRFHDFYETEEITTLI